MRGCPLKQFFGLYRAMQGLFWGCLDLQSTQHIGPCTFSFGTRSIVLGILEFGRSSVSLGLGVPLTEPVSICTASPIPICYKNAPGFGEL